IVDGAVIMVENIMRRYRDADREEKNMGINFFTTNAAGEVGQEIFFSIAIIILAYLPIFSFERIEGRLFKPMAFTISYAILGAMIFSLTAIPVLMTILYRKYFEDINPGPIEWHNHIYEWIENKYKILIAFLVKRSKQTVIYATLLVTMVISVGLWKIGSEFLPELDEGGFTLRAFFPVGISLQGAKQYPQKMRDVISKNEQVNVILSQLGRNDDGTDPLPANRLEIYVGLKDYNDWREKITKQQLLVRMRDDLESTFPGVRFSFSQPIMDNLSEAIMGTIADLGVFVIGNDLTVMRGLAEQILKLVANMEGASEYGIEQEAESPQLNVKINREAAARYGINISEIQQVIESAIGMSRISTLYEGPWRFGIVVRYSNDYRSTIKSVENIPIISSKGERIPLSNLAEVKLVDGPTMIFRQQGRRNITVRTNIRGRDQGGFVSELRKKVEQTIKFPEGYRVEYGGQYENLARVGKRLVIVIPITILIIFSVLFALYRNLRYVAVALACIPLSLIGGLVGLLIRGYYFNVSAGVGFISLFGIATMAGVLYVSRTNQILRDHKDISIEEAAEKAAVIQLRPMLMTILLALLGLIPATLASGVGSDVQRPLATVIVGGLTSAMILVLTVLPSLYLLIVKQEAPTQPDYTSTTSTYSYVEMAGLDNEITDDKNDTEKVKKARRKKKK
ncbi:MAG: efflux RND transporter permease subunit, partial [Leptospiraceae bacterium]|nr:efflux RND transporter permease subunit [Leptospiraceae bacterium]